MKLLAVTLCALACSCASKGAWRLPPDKDAQAFRMDSYECERDASGTHQTMVFDVALQIHNAQNAKEMHRRCMRAKGYRWDSNLVATIER